MKAPLEIPAKTADCKLRFAFRVDRKDGTYSKRATYLCRARDGHGLFLRDWKCVGLNHKDCPIEGIIERYNKKR